jgi:hypothetical protein
MEVRFALSMIGRGHSKDSSLVVSDISQSIR